MVALNDSRQLARLIEPSAAPGLLTRLRNYLPQGNLLDDEAWTRRHLLLRWLLLLHAPGILVFGLSRGYALTTSLYVCAPIVACLLLGTLVQRRRIASFFVTAGLVYCSSALVGLSGGVIEAHFHFFILIGFIALYQDWIPFLWMIVFTVFGHGLGSAWSGTLIFNHTSAQQNPWLWSLIHGVSVLAACVGMVIFWRYSEDEMQKSITLRTRIAESEIERRRFTSDLLVNLARRNQSMLHMQLGIINQLEEAERDPDALADLFKLDHLATRIRRNAESLLVLSGEEPPRVWSQPVQLRDVIRAAIAETEDLDRVDYEIEEDLSVHGRLVTGLTHLLAELVENAVHFSPPQTRVTVRARPDRRVPGTQVITVEDLGLGMPAEDLAAANLLLAEPPDVDLSTSQRYGLHVVSRLAKRLDLRVQLTPTANSGVTAVVLLPPGLFVTTDPRPDYGTVPGGRPEAPRWAGVAAYEPARTPEPAYASAPSYQPAEYLTPAPVSRPSRRPQSLSPLPPPAVAQPAAPAPLPARAFEPERAPEPAPAPEPVRDLEPLQNLEPVRDVEPLQNLEPVRDVEPAHDLEPAPAYPHDPAVTFGVDVRDDGWRGWWGDPQSQPSVSASTPVTQPLSREAVAQEIESRYATAPQGALERVIDLRAAEASDPAEPVLSHRTPQAHLAPELRRRSSEPSVPVADPDASSARDALSAYQARRRAALDLTGQNLVAQNPLAHNASAQNASAQNSAEDGRRLTGWPDRSDG